jgi:hypothetical protein
MAERPPGLENNRFEALYQRWKSRPRRGARWWRRILVAAIILFVLEIASLAATFGWYRLLDQFVLTRYLVSPFVFTNPVTANTKARYLGPYTNACVAAEWRSPDTLLGWTMAPNVGILKQPYRVDNVTAWRFTNAQGFPSSGDYDFFYARPKPSGTFRVIVMGASSVEGDGAEEPKLNLVAQFREQLQRELADKLGGGYSRIEVINGGVAGYQSSQEYLFLISNLVTFEPDLVISYGGAVDVVRAMSVYDREGHVMERIRTFRHNIDTGQLRRSFEILAPIRMSWSNLSRQFGCFVDELAMNYFVGRIYERAEGFVRRVIGAERKALEPQTAALDLSIPIKIGLDSYENSIKLMMKAADIYGFRMTFMLQSAMSTDDKPLTDLEKETFNTLSVSELKLRSTYWAAARKMYAGYQAVTPSDGRFCFVDISRPFDGVHERVWDDSRHLLGIGNKIVGKLMVDALRDCKQLPEK